MKVTNFFILIIRRTSDPGHFPVYLDEDESLIIPKRHSEVKVLNPLTYGDKLYAPLPKINKKHLKYAKHTPIFTKFKPTFDLSDVGKKCCGNKWGLEGKEVSLEELIRPVSLPAYRSPAPSPHLIPMRGYQSFDDVKPVTEIIEDDIKYDFRTQTHSLR